jgi:hypothetical protein
MVVYLIHFDRPYKNGRHCIGFAEDIEAKAKFLAKACVTWRVVRTWRVPRHVGRRFKKRANKPRYCPVCSGDAAFGRGILRPKPLKIMMSQRDQMAFCLNCALSACVGAGNPRCPMRAEQKWRHRVKRERHKTCACTERRRARRTAARQTQMNP